MAPSKRIDVQITNMVASANFEIQLDLYTVASELPDVEYEPEQFPGAILRLDEPKSSLLLFKNGKVICAGTKTKEEVEQALKKALKMLLPYAKKNPNFSMSPKYEFVNLVAAANLYLNLDLYRLAYELEDIEYEPEQFPGAILTLKKHGVSLLLFKNGKVICAGAKSIEQIHKALEFAYDQLKKYPAE
ncbi:MAG: TATA-box-binding protein [Candidatus Micrarchaeota archaeon]|nr:TATA-box-binding protein [Candidatus Micrarchaeota archaeon]